jgi:hypothetical protein
MKTIIFLVLLTLGFFANAQMTQADLSTKLQANIGAVINLVDSAQLKKVCDAIALSVVQEVQTKALVTGTVTSGAGSGGSVTGTVQ